MTSSAQLRGIVDGIKRRKAPPMKDERTGPIRVPSRGRKGVQSPYEKGVAVAREAAKGFEKDLAKIK